MSAEIRCNPFTSSRAILNVSSVLSGRFLLLLFQQGLVMVALSLAVVYHVFIVGILSIRWDANEKGSKKKCRDHGECFGQAECHRAGRTSALYPVRISQDFHR